MSGKKRLCKFTPEIASEFPFIKKSKTNDANVFCNSCNSEFAISSG